MQLDFKVSTKLDQFQADAKAALLGSLDTMRQRLYSVQNEALKNVSDSFDKTLNDTSSLLTSMEGDFQVLKNYGQTNLITLRNETENIREILTSGDALSRCVENDATSSDKDQLLRPYELRVEIRSDDKDYVALYKTFKLENEADKYRIRLGKVTSSIDDGSRGLSYSKNAKFSTFDNDNDDNPGQCAVSYKGGWWYKYCEYSKLNAPWRDGKINKAWYTTGSKYLHAVSTSMKIRPL
ncbi:tenascin [Elysia marginata]|uniref:Tenascin n=1 Tax=Elysia marginata TaxID=1093978 RepID=A0AAV4F985_9GAST|nr:tenascin [Elysia marginata]